MEEGIFITRRERILRERMGRLGIKDGDIIENFISSSGPGGQNVNKVATCVYLKHIPTGVEVKCQKERSQAANRYAARVILCGKIEERLFERASKERQRLEKIHRQNRRRSRGSRLRMLEVKRLHARKKKMRQKVRDLE